MSDRELGGGISQGDYASVGFAIPPIDHVPGPASKSPDGEVKAKWGNGTHDHRKTFLVTYQRWGCFWRRERLTAVAFFAALGRLGCAYK